jgi:hypothetical protein
VQRKTIREKEVIFSLDGSSPGWSVHALMHMRLEPTPKITPKGPPRDFADPELAPIPSWDGDSVDWEAMVAQVIHPAKVAIIEALAWIGRPLSPSLMAEIFSESDLYLSLIAYHVKGLADMGLLEIVTTKPVRGALERFYFFPIAVG